MAFSRSATLGAEGRLGESVWLLLCRSALRGIQWSARALASDDVEERLERFDLLARLGVDCSAGPTVPARHEAAIDWARLSDVDRAWLARELGHRR